MEWEHSVSHHFPLLTQRAMFLHTCIIFLTVTIRQFWPASRLSS